MGQYFSSNNSPENQHLNINSDLKKDPKIKEMQEKIKNIFDNKEMEKDIAYKRFDILPTVHEPFSNKREGKEEGKGEDTIIEGMKGKPSKNVLAKKSNSLLKIAEKIVSPIIAPFTATLDATVSTLVSNSEYDTMEVSENICNHEDVQKIQLQIETNCASVIPIKKELEEAKMDSTKIDENIKTLYDNRPSMDRSEFNNQLDKLNKKQSEIKAGFAAKQKEIDEKEAQYAVLLASYNDTMAKLKEKYPSGVMTTTKQITISDAVSRTMQTVVSSECKPTSCKDINPISSITNELFTNPGENTIIENINDFPY